MSETISTLLDPTHPGVLEFMRKARVLIVDQNPSSRPTLRRFVSSMGARLPNVDIAESFEEAMKKIADTKPGIVFSEYLLDKGTAIELFQAFAQASPARLQTVFIVLVADNYPSTTAAIAEADVDAVIVRPMTYNDLQDKFMEVLSLKLNPSEYTKMLEAGMRFSEAGKPEAALKAFQKAQSLGTEPAMAYCQEGLVRKQMGDPETARMCFGLALKADPQHFRSLLSVYELFIEQKMMKQAFEASVAMSAFYPINPKRIPELIRVCVANEKFTEVLRFHEVIAQLQSADESIVRYVSAGLVVCGRYFLKNGERDEALKAFKKAELTSKSKPGVVKEIIVALFGAGLVAEAEDYLKRAPKGVSSSDEISFAILEQLHTLGPDSKTFLMARGLVNKGIKSQRLYEIYLRQAKDVRRPGSVIQDILSKACADLPQHAHFFEALLAD